MTTAQAVKLRRFFSKKNIVRFLLLNLGLALMAAGIVLFKAPNHFALGGTSGLSIILSALIPGMNLGAAMLLVNLVLVLLGFIFIGRGFAGLTVYASFALSAYVAVLEWAVPLAAPLTQDTLLELLYAVALPAVGSALAFNVGASTGGTDILAMIVSKYGKIEIGKALLVSDFFIALWAGFLFGVRTGLYCVLGLVLKAFLVDTAIESFNVKKRVTIVSEKPGEVTDFIVHKLKRGATVYTAYGAYAGDEKKVITTVLGRRQAVELRNYIREIDRRAFITLVNSSETIGKGFRTI
ncbi:MAG: YitT family protein [Oscillospiraceae bacterium]|nr:YitT family protein [Oscillospiraceae bacterium]